MRNLVDRILRHTLVFLMVLLVFDVVWQVISRYLLNSPSIFTDEVARILLIWISLLGAAYFSGKNLHIAINLVPDRLAPTAQRRLKIFNRLLIILFAGAVLVIGGGRLVVLTTVYLQLTPTLQLPMAIVYLVGPISGLLVIFYKACEIADLLKSDPGEEILPEFDEEEFKGSI